MCGFIGTVNQTIPNFLSLVKKLSHRGPDEQGIYEDKKIQLGFRRLSIIDLKNGAQPLFSKDKRTLIYSFVYLFQPAWESWCNLSGPHPGGLRFIFSLKRVALFLKSFDNIVLIDLSSISLVKYLLFL